MENDITSESVILGFDPGGGNNFGVAMIVGAKVEAQTTSSVSEAMHWAIERCGAVPPCAAGIDSLLHWSDGRAGWRPADLMLRHAYPKTSASVISPNGLYGAMAIGGMALALRLRARWPAIHLNETHPKVLIPALCGNRYSDDNLEAVKAAVAWLERRSGLELELVENGHELDAAISAWATREGLREGWPDLVDDDAALLRPAGPVTYFWPKPLHQALKQVRRRPPPPVRP